MNFYQIFKSIKKAKTKRNVNQIKIPCTQMEICFDNADFINYLIEKFEKAKYNKIVRTSRGSFAYSKTVFPAYDLRSTKSIIELTVCDTEMYRIQLRHVSFSEETGNNLNGRAAFKTFKEICLKHGVNLDDYKIDNGNEVKKEIDKYIILLGPDAKEGHTYENAHHIDFHSSFPSGLVNTHPEFRPIIQELYNGRKQNEDYKFILNAGIGYMQSMACCKAKWAGLARDAINDNNKRVLDLAQTLIDNGRFVLAFNTDGIWYKGPLYHGDGEGDNICEWHNDHTNCKIRFKSAGSYEYMEDGVYKPVVRGRTLLDEMKPRSEWQWGDIYQEHAVPQVLWINYDTYRIEYGGYSEEE